MTSMSDTIAGTRTPSLRQVRPRRVESEPVSLRRSVDSEWVKFRTLRSSWAMLGAAGLVMVIFSLIIAYNTRHLNHPLQAGDIAPSGTLQGYYLAELLIGALGVLFVSGEYSTGMIRSTLAAVPRRIPVLWGKLIVFVSIIAAAMIVMSFVAFFAGQGLISAFRPAFSLGDPGVLRVIIGTAVYLTFIGMIGAALGWIMRSTPGGLVAFVGLILVLPVLFGDALGHWGKHVAEFFPSTAGASFSTSIPEAPSLSPWVGLLVMGAWVVIGISVALVLLRRRDA
jgi:ABC-type transport system involved in multi-copper enzyme maturation permease subunit